MKADTLRRRCTSATGARGPSGPITPPSPPYSQLAAYYLRLSAHHLRLVAYGECLTTGDVRHMGYVLNTTTENSRLITYDLRLAMRYS